MLLDAMIALFIAAVAIVAVCATVGFILRYSSDRLKSAGDEIDRRNAVAERFFASDEN